MKYLLDTNACIGYMNGRAAGVHQDLLIAATALAQGVSLVTHNMDEFKRVPDLILEDWQA